ACARPSPTIWKPNGPQLNGNRKLSMDLPLSAAANAPSADCRSKAPFPPGGSAPKPAYGMGRFYFPSASCARFCRFHGPFRRAPVVAASLGGILHAPLEKLLVVALGAPQVPRPRYADQPGLCPRQYLVPYPARIPHI